MNVSMQHTLCEILYPHSYRHQGEWGAHGLTPKIPRTPSQYDVGKFVAVPGDAVSSQMNVLYFWPMETRYLKF